MVLPGEFATHREMHGDLFGPAVIWQAPRLLIGAGVTAEIGYELGKLGVHDVLLVTDPTVAETGVPERVRSSIAAAGIGVDVLASATVEPSEESCQELADSLHGVPVDCYVAVGGGSSIDTAKVLNLLAAEPDTKLRDYVNQPIGAGRTVGTGLRPLVAVPTTAGSGSECTAMVALGITELRVKTGIADRALTPALAVVDPENTVTLPPAVTASGGYDVLTHACESFTCLRFDHRPGYASPDDRPIYIGANPISDIWAEQALRLLGEYFVRAVLSPHDLEARTAMSYAAVYAGMGFGNAGTHIPHANAYPIAGMVESYRPRDYAVTHPMVPHGEAVVSTAPAAFEFTYDACPQRHLRAAELLGYSTAATGHRERANALPTALADIIAATGGPAGIAGFGYTDRDVPELVDGSMKQQRLLAGCPRAVGPAELERIFRASLNG